MGRHGRTRQRALGVKGCTLYGLLNPGKMRTWMERASAWDIGFLTVSAAGN
ncbi:MAG: hypothetical protein Q6L60_12595 [Thermostichus sp. HHBFW_bins_43]